MVCQKDEWDDHFARNFSKNLNSIFKRGTEDIINAKIGALVGIFLLTLTATGCSAQEQTMPSKITVFTTLNEAKVANPSFRRLSTAQLNVLFSRPISLDFSANGYRAGGSEKVDPDHNWRFSDDGALSIQVPGQWSISNDTFCVKYQGSESSQAPICREIWADPSAKYGIIKNSFEFVAGVLKPTGRGSFYVLEFQEIEPDPSKTIQ